MIFSNIRTDFNFIFGQFSVARKLISNGGASCFFFFGMELPWEGTSVLYRYGLG